jgi:undecaprenyl-diphosphatase
MHPPVAPARAARRRPARHALAGIGGAVLFLGLLGLVEWHWGPLARLDRHGIEGLHGYAHRHTAWTAAMQTLTDIGGPVTMRVAVLAVAAWLGIVGARTLSCWASAQALLGWAAAAALRDVIGMPRPHFADPVSHASGSSLPSDHAMASAITCAALAALIWPVSGRALRIGACTVAALAVLAVGWSRIAVGAERVSDVLAGWLAAATTLGLLTAAVELWRPGALVRDLATVNRLTRPRVQRVLVRGAGLARPLGEDDEGRGGRDSQEDGAEGRENAADDASGRNARSGVGRDPGRAESGSAPPRPADPEDGDGNGDGRTARRVLRSGSPGGGTGFDGRPAPHRP